MRKKYVGKHDIFGATLELGLLLGLDNLSFKNSLDGKSRLFQADSGVSLQTELEETHSVLKMR